MPILILQVYYHRNNSNANNRTSPTAAYGIAIAAGNGQHYQTQAQQASHMSTPTAATMTEHEMRHEQLLKQG